MPTVDSKMWRVLPRFGSSRPSLQKTAAKRTQKKCRYVAEQESTIVLIATPDPWRAFMHTANGIVGDMLCSIRSTPFAGQLDLGWPTPDQ